MTNPTHTPGPWMVTPDHDAIDKARAEGRDPHVLHDNRFVSSMGGVLVCSLRDQTTQRADARLIAAAPDLLAALKQVYSTALDALGCGPNFPQPSTLLADLALLCTDAIAKAEGGDK